MQKNLNLDELNKEELIKIVSFLIQSDANETPASYEMLEFLSTDELKSVAKNLQKSKNEWSNEEFFKELLSK